MRLLIQIGLKSLLIITVLTVTNSHAQNWVLVWSDEFNGEELDLSRWSYQIGTGTSEGLFGWGNNELQYYTDREENIFVENGKLHIIARQENYNNRNFTSARIRSKDKGDWKYGRMEVRAKMPEGQGIWPAIWMMPTESVYGNWPASGEIDIMELVGNQPNLVHGTVHYGTAWNNHFYNGGSYRLDEENFSDSFYTYSIIWSPGRISWYVNDDLYHIVTPGTLQPNHWPFDQLFHFILNVAVGGNWPGSPDGTTQFPQEMIVDYVRVYQDPDTTKGASLPVDFENSDFLWDYWVVDFDGGIFDVIENPHKNDDNPSDYVGRMIKDDGFFWAGAWIPVDEPLVFNEENFTISMKVWSPRENVPVLMKIEQQFGTSTFEMVVNTTTSEEWEELTWDMSGAGFEEEWDILTIIFDFVNGQVGNGSSDFTWYLDDIRVISNEISTSAENVDDALPGLISLKQNYPNPFNPATKIQFELEKPTVVTLDIFDIMGRHVKTLANGYYQMGNHTVNFDASSLASGVYLYRLIGGDLVQIKKMLLAK